jgi:hypothetical protein
MSALRASYERYRAHSDSHSAMPVWIALTLAMWLESV